MHSSAFFFFPLHFLHSLVAFVSDAFSSFFFKLFHSVDVSAFSSYVFLSPALSSLFIDHTLLHFPLLFCILFIFVSLNLSLHSLRHLHFPQSSAFPSCVYISFSRLHSLSPLYFHKSSAFLSVICCPLSHVHSAWSPALFSAVYMYFSCLHSPQSSAFLSVVCIPPNRLHSPQSSAFPPIDCIPLIFFTFISVLCITLSRRHIQIVHALVSPHHLVLFPPPPPRTDRLSLGDSGAYLGLACRVLGPGWS